MIVTTASWRLPIVLLFRNAFQCDQASSREHRGGSPNARRVRRRPMRIGLGELGEVDAGRLARAGRHVIPRFLGGVRDDRGQDPGQGVMEPGQDELGGAAVGARRRPRRRGGP